jgi:type II secretory pathway component PulK
MRPQAEGFALLAVLGLLAVVGLYTAATIQESLFGTVLAGTRVFQQRAFVLADHGVEAALRKLGETTVPVDDTRDLRPLPGEANGVTVELRVIGDAALPAGFSADRFVTRRFEIHSTGRAARGARSVQVQGAVRVQPMLVEEP